MQNVWVIRAKGGDWTSHFLKGGYVGGGWLNDKSLSEVTDRAELDELYRRAEPSRSPNWRGSYASQLDIFLLRMQPGDYVITPAANSRWMYYGRLLDEPYYFSPDNTDDCYFSHRRKVAWTKEPLDRLTLEVPFQYTMRASKTAFHVSHRSEFFEKIGLDVPKLEVVVPDSHDVVLGQILKHDAGEFEGLIADLLNALKFTSVEVTGKPGDDGIDVTGELNVPKLANVKVIIQAKRYQSNHKVSAETVKALAKALPSGAQGAVITTSSFDNSAQSEASDEGIGLIDGHALVDLLVENWDAISEEFREKLGLKRGLVLG